MEVCLRTRGNERFVLLCADLLTPIAKSYLDSNNQIRVATYRAQALGKLGRFKEAEAVARQSHNLNIPIALAKLGFLAWKPTFKKISVTPV